MDEIPLIQLRENGLAGLAHSKTSTLKQNVW